MTTAGVKHEAPPPTGAVRRIGSEVVALLALPARAPRRLASSARLLSAGQLVLGLLAAAALIAGAMLVPAVGWLGNRLGNRTFDEATESCTIQPTDQRAEPP